MLILQGMNPQPQIGRTKALSQVTARSVVVVILLGFVLALSAARSHVVGTLVHDGPGAAAEVGADRPGPGLEAGRDVSGESETTTASLPAQARGCTN
jgi:hypothetical protein